MYHSYFKQLPKAWQHYFRRAELKQVSLAKSRMVSLGDKNTRLKNLWEKQQ